MYALGNNYEPLVLVDTSNLSREQWLDYRRKGIGGSDAAAVLAISPFRAARDIFYDKLNIASITNDEGNWVALKVGNLLEDLVAEIFVKKTGLHIYQVKKMFMHPLHRHMLADTDYLITLPNGKTAVLECKTTNYNAKSHWWEDGKEIVPPYYEAQGRHYMAVLNVDEVFFCCLYGNSEDDVIIRHIVRDAAYEEELIFVEEYFWNEYVLTKTPPPCTEDGDVIAASNKRHIGPALLDEPAIQLDDGMAMRIGQFLRLQKQKAEVDAIANDLKKKMDRLRAIVAAQMGQCCTACCEIEGVKYTVTNRPVRKNELKKNNLLRLQIQFPDIYQTYVTETEYRRFDVKEVKTEAA